MTAALLAAAAIPLAGAAVPGVAAAPACPSDAPTAVAGALGRQVGGGAATVKARLGTRGQFLGRSLRVAAARGVTLELTLPLDSSVAPPVGNVQLFTQSTGGRSEVHAVDLDSGCDFVLARVPAIARSAVLAPDGSAVYVHSVAAMSRDDLGVTRYALTSGAEAVVVPPLTEDLRFGPTFGTQLAFSPDGRTLAVQSCGADACRTRLLDVASGRIDMFDDAHGALIGVTSAAVVAYDSCVGLPCPVVAIDRSTGSVRELAAQAWAATLVSDGDSTVVSIETAAGTIEVEP